MLAARTLLVAFAIVALATLAVEAGTRNTPQGDAAARRPHPEETATPETRALWARIHEELKARNYSRPSSEAINAARRAAGLGPVVRAPNGGAFGVDISQWMGQDTWGCLKNNGYDFGIVRAYEEVCAVDPNGVHSVANAWAAGIAHVDIYLFPSYGCGNGAAAQVDATIDNMGSIPFGQLWFDIETGGQGSASSNYDWLKEGVDQAVARLGGSRVGIYSSQYEWGQVMGSYGGFTSFPVWYADYDGSPSFGGFLQFGGWTSPSMKQYAGDANVCSFDVDLNWYP